MSKTCEICKHPTIFFIWSSSRRFKRKGVVKVIPNLSDAEKRKYLKNDYVVCFGCAEKYGLMER